MGVLSIRMIGIGINVLGGDFCEWGVVILKNVCYKEALGDRVDAI